MKKIFAAVLCILLTLTVVSCSKKAEIGFNETRVLTKNDVLELSGKGEKLTWGDLENFKHGEDIGSGLYVVVYEIDDSYELTVGGGTPSEEDHPIYAYLTDKNTEQFINIMEENPAGFLK